MRNLASKERIEEFMRTFGRIARSEVHVYFTGGTTAVLHGWRDSTVDIDLKFIPEPDELFRALPDLKERLQINVELAAPSDFIPELPGWVDRCEFIAREGKVSFFNYDIYSQALAKIERNHSQDKLDVASMFRDQLLESARLLSLFEQIEPSLYKYPAIDQATFKALVHEAIEAFRS